MKHLPALSAFLIATLAVTAGCPPIPRDQACIDADACDLNSNFDVSPTGNFKADDPVFGDLGTCWQNDVSAKPCIDACVAFLNVQAAQPNPPPQCVAVVVDDGADDEAADDAAP
jgi:hypothetical protein